MCADSFAGVGVFVNGLLNHDSALSHLGSSAVVYPHVAHLLTFARSVHHHQVNVVGGGVLEALRRASRRAHHSKGALGLGLGGLSLSRSILVAAWICV